VLDTYPNEVRIVIKHFPLSYHEYSEKAARAALAANLQGKFWEFHNKLFENYESINDAIIQDIARELNLDVEKLNRDMESPTIKGLITRDVNNGRQAGVSGTPTIFINGKLLKRLSVEAFYQLLEAELRKNR